MPSTAADTCESTTSPAEQEADSPPEPAGRNAAWLTPGFQSAETRARLLIYRTRINLCCFKPLCLWQQLVVATALENRKSQHEKDLATRLSSVINSQFLKMTEETTTLLSLVCL